MRLVSPIRWVLLSALAGTVLGAGAPAQRPHGQQGGHRMPAPAVHTQPAQQHPATAPQQQHPQAAPVVRQNAPSGQAQPGQPGGSAQTQAAPIERREAPPAVTARVSPNNIPPNSNVKGLHLNDWMRKHSNLTPEQQQQALEQVPGFHDYPQVTQQRLRDELARVNALPPQERQRKLQEGEELERLTPEQHAQWTGALQQYTSLPQDQKRAVNRSLMALRLLPPAQRAAALNSGRYTYGFNDAQRSTLNNLIRVEPLVPSGFAPAPK